MIVNPLLKDTNNPIRAIVDNLVGKENPKKELISLAQGDPTAYGHLKPPEEAVTAVVRAYLSGNHNGYTASSGSVACRTALAAAHSCPNRPPLSCEDVYVTVGCSEAIEHCIAVLAAPGSNIILPRPGFPLYETLCQRHGVICRFYDLLPEDAWQIDIESIRRVADSRTAAGHQRRLDSPAEQTKPPSTPRTAVDSYSPHSGQQHNRISPGPVAVRRRGRPEVRERAPRVALAEAHGAVGLAGRELREPGRLLLRRAVRREERDRPVRDAVVAHEARVRDGERQVRERRGADGQAEAALVLLQRHADEAALGVLLLRVDDGRRVDDGVRVRVVGRRLAVAAGVRVVEDLLGERRPGLDDGFDGLHVVVPEALRRQQRLEVDELVEQELELAAVQEFRRREVRCRRGRCRSSGERALR